MLNKKIIIFLSVITSIIFLIVFFIMLIIGKQTPKRPGPLPTLIPDNEAPTAPPTPVTTADKIKINGIAVKNFYSEAVKTNSNGDVLIVDNPRYQISYLKQFEQFKITILGADFEAIKNEAENKFLIVTSLDKQNACRLNVEEDVLSSAGGRYAGSVFPLSFCADNEFKY